MCFINVCIILIEAYSMIIACVIVIGVICPSIVYIRSLQFVLSFQFLKGLVTVMAEGLL